MTQLKAAIFDLGGTLWESKSGKPEEEVLAAVAPDAMRLLPPDVAAALNPAEVGLAVRRAYLELEEASCNGDPKPVPGELTVLNAMRGLGVNVDSDTARAMTAAFFVSERDTARLLDGAADALRKLAAMGLRMGVISNRMHGGSRLTDDLQYFGIGQYFSSVLASGVVGQMKPHASIFRRALAELDVRPEQAVMVGDDLRADVGGALAVGMRAVWVRRPPTRTDQPPSGVPAITTLVELPSVIAAMA